MAEISMKNIVKQYGDGFPAVNDVSLDIADGEFMILVGPSGLREVDAAADDRRARGHHLRRHAHRRQAGQRQGAARPQPGDGVPELRALPAPHRVREHRLPAAAARACRTTRSRPGSRRRPRRSSSPSTSTASRQPLRRPAPAGRDGPGDRAGGRRLPVRRAAVQPRRQAARPDAHRDRPHAAPARHDHRLRHPRPDRGDDARRPGRRAAQGRAPAGRLTPRAVRAARSTCSSPGSSARRR